MRLERRGIHEHVFRIAGDAKQEKATQTVATGRITLRRLGRVTATSGELYLNESKDSQTGIVDAQPTDPVRFSEVISGTAGGAGSLKRFGNNYGIVLRLAQFPPEKRAHAHPGRVAGEVELLVR